MKFQVDNNSTVSSFTKGKQKMPTPPKKGELMYCQICGAPMLPKDFSENEILRKREFKWHIHAKCFNELDNMTDRAVPGLMAERKKLESRR